MVLPKPFAKCYLFGGEPIELPVDLTKQQTTEYRELLQREMEQLERVARHFVATGELDYDLRSTEPQSKAA